MRLKCKALLVEVPWENSDLGKIMADSDELTFYVLSHHGGIAIPPDGIELVLELRKIGMPPNEILMGTSDGGKTLFPVLGCIRDSITVKLLDPQGVLRRLP